MRRAAICLLAGLAVSCANSRKPGTVPSGEKVDGSGKLGTGSGKLGTVPGGEKAGGETKVLKAGAKVLQKDTPPRLLDMYLVGFHPMKDKPVEQMEAHHFCKQVNEDFAQCALFDGNTKEANLTGVEYIISEKLFKRLPPGETKYWHPHNGEILSGQLVASGLPQVAEKELMRRKMNSYGKTWHLWNTKAGDKLPLGPPMLAWSFSRDGELRQDLIDERDKALGVSTAKARESRQDLVPLAHPQSGVDDLKGKFSGATKRIPGVGF